MKKSAKTKSSQTHASAAQDIVGLITTLVERLVSLETKMDTVLSRIPARPAEPPRQHTPPSVPHAPPVNARPMYTAVCADCGTNCEVPFKPSAGRPVYCKGCYSARRNNGSSVLRTDIPPKETQPMPARQPEKPRAVKSAASAGKKKPAAKKAKKKSRS